MKEEERPWNEQNPREKDFANTPPGKNGIRGHDPARHSKSHEVSKIECRGQSEQKKPHRYAGPLQIFQPETQNQQAQGKTELQVQHSLEKK